MLSNRELSRAFRLASQLMELHDENPFKVRSMQNASFKIDKIPEPLSSLTEAELAAMDGIGKSTASKITALNEKGVFSDLEELIAKTPGGVIEMLAIKGIGPKKVRALWKELGIESVGELLYACNENRLVELKGFGAKTQEQVRQAIEYARSNEGKYHYATVEIAAMQLVHDLEESAKVKRISFTGMLRRKCEVLEKAELIALMEDRTAIMHLLKDNPKTASEGQKESIDSISFETSDGIPIDIRFSTEVDFEKNLFLSTSSDAHLTWLKKRTPDAGYSGSTEAEIYQRMGLPYFEPEFREGVFEEKWMNGGGLPAPVTYEDLVGTLHNHTTYSDGMHTLEEMATYCKSMGYQYLGVCDHSRSAFYANGLQPERVLKQHEEIEKLNAKMAPFRIFKGIESDILNDGSLDYDEDLLTRFDFIVASVHSVLRMDKQKATTRLIKAIEHPRTTILGHPTGRLLLAREGYPLEMEKVIDACAANEVVIELNANPYRLDLEWRFIPYALEKGVKISINPDAHRKEGYHDMHYGVCVARKGGLTKKDTFNSFGTQAVSAWFEKKK